MVRLFAATLAAWVLSTTVQAQEAAKVPTPADIYGPLFHQVQTRRIFPDGTVLTLRELLGPGRLAAPMRRTVPAESEVVVRCTVARGIVIGISLVMVHCQKLQC